MSYVGFKSFLNSFDPKFLPYSLVPGSGPDVALLKFRPFLFGEPQELKSLPLTKRVVEPMTPPEGSIEIYNQETPFWQCSDIIGYTAKFIDLAALNALSKVNMKSCEAVMEFRRTRLRNYVDRNGFGANKWERFFGKVPGVQLPLELLDILNEPCPIFPGKTVKETHILFLLPETVNDQPLTLNSLREIVKAPKKDSGGHAIRYTKFSRDVESEFGRAPNAASCWVLMLKDVMPGSRNKSFDAQCRLIPSSSSGCNYEVPGLLDATAGIMTYFVRAGERLYSATPYTYTRCKEEKYLGHKSIVGGFDELGPDADSYSNDNPVNGLAILRKFPGPRPSDT